MAKDKGGIYGRPFKDKGDTYDGRKVTCGACGTQNTITNPLGDHSCSCGRVLNGTGRSDMPDMPPV